MSTSDRRKFLQTAALGTLGIAAERTAFAALDEPKPATPEKPADKPEPPKEEPDVPKLVIGVIGPGGMGSNHVRVLCDRKDVEIAVVCDVDDKRATSAAHTVETLGKPRPKIEKDMRAVFADKRVDAVFIATPDHWHAPASLLALEAGKHVYVEKPLCHNIREGRLLVDAVERSGKRLQVGTQSRGTAHIRAMIERIHKGEIGEVLVAKAWNSQKRSNIGKSQPAAPPEHLNFEDWLGPAPKVDYRSNLLHSVWRWWYDFGCGDIGNDGVHDIDVACWGLGVDTHPSTAACIGGKYFFDDDQQFPDTQYAVFEYPNSGGKKKQLIFEQRIWSPYVQEGYENGVAFYGTTGLLILGHSVGYRLYGERNKLIEEKYAKPDLVAHHQNFFDAIRKPDVKLFADVKAGHLGATLVHLANIAARTNATLQFDPKTEQITNHTDAAKLVRRQYRENHWGVPKGV